MVRRMSALRVPPGSADDLDLTTCDREPIRIPGQIQPYGALLVVDPATQQVMQAAVSEAAAPLIAGDPVGQSLKSVLPGAPSSLFDGLAARLADSGALYLGVVSAGDATFHLIAHLSGPRIIVEAERMALGEPGTFDQIYPYIRSFLNSVHGATSIAEMTALAASEVRRITGLDRALVYQFDEAWNGAVIAESRNETLPSYLGLRFPASDIPAQARELYRLNRLRLISDANYEPVPILPRDDPETGQPVDLSLSVLRSVSPVHLEYMRNMGTMASMSISLLRNDNLWGLISCHNAAPARVPYHVRTACDFIGQVLSMQLAAREASAAAERRIELRAVQTRLLAAMAGQEHFVDGLIASSENLLALTHASGAAIVSGGNCVVMGETPEPYQILNLIEWLGGRERKDLIATDALATLWPAAEAFKDSASGVIGISISQIHDSYVLWFRPEVIRTVSWGGEPTKSMAPSEDGLRLHPRQSFATWQETVRLHGRPWDEAEIDAALELRTAIVDIVLRKAEELAALTERLKSINKELEAFSYSVSHDLRAPFRHIVGYAQLLKKFEGSRLSDRGNRYIDTIVESAISAGTLVDDLLSFSQMGRATLSVGRIDMNALVADVKRRLTGEADTRAVDWHIANLPPARGDATMMRLVWQNLLDNAIKFTRGRERAEIEIGCQSSEGETTYFVRDNGTGFDMAYVGKLFGVFQRLHRVEDFEGTGIGLANVKRIVERHGGRVWAEGAIDKGATVFFSLPTKKD